MDSKDEQPCCQFASDEDIDCEPDIYNCDACPVADAVASLDEPNAEAWKLFQRLATRLAVDAHLIPEIWRFYTQSLTESEYDELFDRLCLIYDLVMPKPTTK